jgi:hypothetical protein
MGGPCPATPPSTDRTGEVLIALGKISRQPLRPTSVSKPTRTCVRYATKCLSPGRMVVDKNPMIPNERHLSGDQSSEEEAQGGAGRT